MAEQPFLEIVEDFIPWNETSPPSHGWEDCRVESISIKNRDMKIPLMEPRAHKSLSGVDAASRRMARLQMTCENSHVSVKEPRCRRLSAAVLRARSQDWWTSWKCCTRNVQAATSQQKRNVSDPDVETARKNETVEVAACYCVATNWWFIIQFIHHRTHFLFVSSSAAMLVLTHHCISMTFGHFCGGDLRHFMDKKDVFSFQIISEKDWIMTWSFNCNTMTGAAAVMPLNYSAPALLWWQ